MKYEFKCGCIRPDYKIVKKLNGAKVKMCPEHKEQMIGRYVMCIDGCGTEIKIGRLGNSQRRCPVCHKVYRRKIHRISIRKKPRADRFGHSTEAEIEFIRNLKPETAGKYLDGLKRRKGVEWEGFELGKCIEACKQQSGRV